MLSRTEMIETLRDWYRAWDRHDLDGVMAMFDDAVVFENWTGGRVEGKENLRRAWSGWFAEHGGFRFIEEETFADVVEQKALFRWRLEWPSRETGYEGRGEVRRGLDVLHLKDGKIVRKLTYSKTTLLVDGARVRLVPATQLA